MRTQRDESVSDALMHLVDPSNVRQDNNHAQKQMSGLGSPSLNRHSGQLHHQKTKVQADWTYATLEGGRYHMCSIEMNETGWEHRRTSAGVSGLEMDMF